MTAFCRLAQQADRVPAKKWGRHAIDFTASVT
jgi:hypothetical protein